MYIQTLPLKAIIPYTRNPRHNAAGVAKVVASIQAFGFKQLMVVDKDHVIVAGHTRWLAAQQLGLTEVPVVVADDLTPEQIKAYRLADNRTHEEATWDTDLLALELGDLQACDFDLSLTGFNTDEIQGFMALAEAVETGLTHEDDCPEPPKKSRCHYGQRWALGRHRLFCGDATCLTDVQALMEEQRADLGFTDPPYNVDYHGGTPDDLTLMGDHLPEDQFKVFLDKTFAAYRHALKPTASLYVCHPSLYQHLFQQALEASGFAIRNAIIWAKHHFAWGMGRYKYQHEPIFYCHQQGQVDVWYGDKSQSTLWQVDKPTANRLHPTMKPVALIEKALTNSSQAGDVVLDLLAGSGSTLLACEKTGRIAYTMEIDPQYCDVIIERWQAFTGQTASLLNPTTMTA